MKYLAVPAFVSLLFLASCAPQLRFKQVSATNSTNSANVTYTVKIDDSTWDLSTGGTTEYKSVNAGSTHTVSVVYTVDGKDLSSLVQLLYTPLSIATFELGQKYTYDMTLTNNVLIRKD
jgi:CRISPR/Cas system CSM-associated protein Csm3 (group 7 of RAMP superfamily)